MAAVVSENGDEQAAEPRGGDVVKRHRLSTRLWHWINAVTLLVMLMSGLMIFNAHPRLYWGRYGANFDPAWLEIGARGDHGMLRIGPVTIPTTGLLGASTDAGGTVQHYAFPTWATLPGHYDLAGARVWHLAFAWVLALSLLWYLVWSLIDGHLRRDVHITAREWRPAHIWDDVKQHARLRFPTGVGALKYNVLQKIAYASVLFLLLPVMIATGMAMSPGMDANWGWLTELWGGRQSARSIHFLAMVGLVGFFLVHIAMVVLAGPLNEVRSIVTGRYRLPRDRPVRVAEPAE